MTWDLQRFEAHVRTEPNSGCWLWDGAPDKDGYGTFHVTHRRRVRAHRFAYEAFVGPIPPGLFVLHSCDVRCCVNPDHLRVGTQAENIADMDRRGRRGRGYVRPNGSGASHWTRSHSERLARGERHGSAKLTEASVRAIREAHAAGARVADLAMEAGIHRSMIRRIVLRRSWRHVA